MKLSDVMSHMGLSAYAEVALLIFLGVFIGVVFDLLVSAPQHQAARLLPLLDDAELARRSRAKQGDAMTVSTIPGAPNADSKAPSEAASPAATPSEENLLDHAYDGIREFDNPLPRWWVRIFWGSFVFAIGYGFHYHVSHNGVSVADAYAADVAEARALESKRALSDTVSEDGLQKLMQDPAQMADAKALFSQRCTPCHGNDAQGVIGPNLTDEYWLHGGKLLEIHHTVSEGVPEKGMPPWKAQLSPVQVRQLAALVGSFRGKNLPGKAAEGTLVPASH